MADEQFDGAYFRDRDDSFAAAHRDGMRWP
jgi:hypothetical protein